MKLLREYFNNLSLLSEDTWNEVSDLFVPKELKTKEFFAKEFHYAREIAFLESGCVRAFFTNSDGKEYNKQFFVGPSIIGAYTSLLTGGKNKIPQQALTGCKIWVTNYQELENRYKRFHDLERLGRKLAEFYFLEKEKKELEMGLLDSTERYLNFCEQFPGLEQSISQYHIASYLSISTTQLSRLRKKL